MVKGYTLDGIDDSRQKKSIARRPTTPIREKAIATLKK
jgi:hypothetical protein